jgi:hypothetical protein
LPRHGEFAERRADPIETASNVGRVAADYFNWKY